MDDSTLKILLDNLEKSQTSLHSCFHFWTFLVVVGVALDVLFVIMEYREDLHDFRRGIIHSPQKPGTLLLTLGLLGAGLVASGVAGELFIDVKISAVETNIRNANDLRASLLSKDAGDAKTSAMSAHDDADAVAKDAKSISHRLRAASDQLGILEQDALAQGPRWRLLRRGEKAFTQALKPFAGQKATVVICGQDDPERFALEQALMDLLRKAGWPSPGYRRWDECPVMLTGGNEVFFVSASGTDKQWLVPYFRPNSSDVSDATGVAPAAKALCDVLNRLKISTLGWMEAPPQDPQNNQQEITRARLFLANGVAGSPGELALEEPTTVFILIGPNQPVFASEDQSSRKRVQTK